MTHQTTKKFYTRQGLWTLFLMCALPPHIWTIILAFRDFSWIADRTNSWDAIGVISYGLVFAFIESIVIFSIAILLGFLVSNKWDEERRIALMSVLVIIISIWAIANQMYFLEGISPSAQIIQFFVSSKRPLVALYISTLFFVGISFSVPAYLILKSNKAQQVVHQVLDRLSFLMSFYLIFDIMAAIVLLIRNL